MLYTVINESSSRRLSGMKRSAAPPKQDPTPPSLPLAASDRLFDLHPPAMSASGKIVRTSSAPKVRLVYSTAEALESVQHAPTMRTL